jgi:hypothetical protein
MPLKLPEWTVGIKCPTCHKEIKENGIKEIGIYGKTNVPVSMYKAGNKEGNVFVSVLCENCGFFGPIMFETKIETMLEFTRFILNEKNLKGYDQLILIGV